MHSNNYNQHQHSKSTNKNCSCNVSYEKNRENYDRLTSGMQIFANETALNCDFIEHHCKFDPKPEHISTRSLPTPTAPYEMSSNNSCVQFPSIRTSSTSFHSSRSIVYVYELPYDVRKSICDLLGTLTMFYFRFK